ncbi:MAG: FG-GAP-like repeat-containing protein [Planctomycetota bacterium]|jgi:hypothetical protein
MKSTHQLCLILILLTVGGCEREIASSSKSTQSVAITNVSVPETCVQGDTIPIVVSVENRGDQQQMFEVILTDRTDGREIGRKSLTPAATDNCQMDESADLILTGENPGDKFGTYNFSGDINGDGCDDLLVAGASRYNDNQGRVYLYLGGSKMDGVPDLIITGDNHDDYFGEVGPLGDVNGDGYDDLVVGAPGYRDLQGRVYIYYGGPDMDPHPDLILDGERVQNRFGRSIALGDINNDGYEDVFVAADYYDNLKGRVYLYYGGDPTDTKPDKIFDGEQEGELFGRCIYNQNKIADVDGDGYGDILISSRNWNKTQGRAYLYYGGPGKSMDTKCDLLFTGESLGDDFGVSGVLFDIDNDGFADVLIGARKWPGDRTYKGRVYLYWGSSRGTMDNVADLMFTGEPNASAAFGGDCVAVGYVNDDEYGDIIITAYDYYRRSRHGRAYVYYGDGKPSIDTVIDRTFTGDKPANLIMNAVIADFNGDTHGDIAIGGWGYPNETNQGRVWVHYGELGFSSDTTFHWDTTTATPGKHTLRASIAPVAGEEDTADNSMTVEVEVKERRQ